MTLMDRVEHHVASYIYERWKSQQDIKNLLNSSHPEHLENTSFLCYTNRVLTKQEVILSYNNI